MPKPINFGNRMIVLEPTYISSDAEIDVWVDGKKQLKHTLMDKTKHLYNFNCECKFHGAVEVKIVVNKGSLSISPQDAFSFYPALYDNDVEGNPIEGIVPVKQFYYINWMQSLDEKLDSHPKLDSGDSLTYYHLIPNGPEWIDVFFNKEKHRLFFEEKRFLTHSMMKECHFDLRSDYYIRDMDLSVEEKTERLLTELKYAKAYS